MNDTKTSSLWTIGVATVLMIGSGAMAVKEKTAQWQQEAIERQAAIEKEHRSALEAQLAEDCKRIREELGKAFAELADSFIDLGQQTDDPDERQLAEDAATSIRNVRPKCAKIEDLIPR